MNQRRMNLGQRAILIIALGAVLVVCGSWLTSNGSISGHDLILPYYSPESGAFASSSFHPNARAHILIWFFLIAIWTAISLFLLRGKSGRRPIRHDEGTKPTDNE
jgi:hypothetical protein